MSRNVSMGSRKRSRVSRVPGNGDATPGTIPARKGGFPELTAPSARQNELIAFLRAFRDEHGYMPTLREAGSHFNCHQNAIKGMLGILKRLNILDYEPRRSRSIRFIGETLIYVKDEHADKVREFYRLLDR